MTINIALASYDGIILGCDSLSSVVDQVIFPFREGCQPAKGPDGQILLDADGMPYFPLQGVTQVATNVFGGVSKMFSLYQDEGDSKDTCVAALTAGMATIQDVTIAEQARRYRRMNDKESTKFTTVEDVASNFKDFIRALWMRQFGDTLEDQRPYLPNIHFIVAGHGVNDDYGKVYKIDIATDQVVEQFPHGDHMGICWNGMADNVERLILGVDTQIRITATRQMAEAIATQRTTTISDISRALQGANVELPEDLHLEITEHTPPTLPWDNSRADIDYGNLSTQYGVDLVELLVNTQSGMQRFSRGIPMVGGRTHIGVLKRGEGFKLLNAPELQHRHTGYGHEF